MSDTAIQRVPKDANIIYLTAGAGGTFCGSCLHDNALAKALTESGWQVQLVPTYTPIRTDETDVSVDQVLFGGINVYLQQKIPLFRHLPTWVDSFLDRPGLIRRVTARAMQTDPKMLGELAHSMLLGEQGNQRKEVRRMCGWLKTQRPDLIVFSNILIGGCIESIKQQLDVPVLVTLQGDDVFLDRLQEPYRSRCLERIKQIAQRVDGFIVHSEFFRKYMASYLDLPLEKIHVTPLGIETTDFAQQAPPETQTAPTERFTIGYLARLAPEKGLHNLVDALTQLPASTAASIDLKVAGWLGSDDADYANDQWQKLDDAGWQGRYEYLGSVDRAQKLSFLSSLDAFCVPTAYQEPKGLYLLEALAAGVPVVAPAHGAFPELLKGSGGGLLVPPNDPRSLGDAFLELKNNSQQRIEMAITGREFVLQHRNAKTMAQATAAVFDRHLT